MKKYLLCLFILFGAFSVLAQTANSVESLIEMAAHTTEDEEKEAYNKFFMDIHFNNSSLVNEYKTNLKQEQKDLMDLIERINKRCPILNIHGAPILYVLNLSQGLMNVEDRILIERFEQGELQELKKTYESALARKKLRDFVLKHQEEIYAYTTLFCPRHAAEILDSSNDFSYDDFYKQLPPNEQQELNRVVYISRRHYAKLKELGLLSNPIEVILQKVPAYIRADFKKKNPLAESIDTYCQDECHVHDIEEGQKAKGINPQDRTILAMGHPVVLSPWQFHAKEYAKENMKITEKRCDESSCPCQTGFYGHRQSFTEVADDVERLKGEIVVFLEDGTKDDIIIDSVLPHSRTNGRIVIFPNEQDDNNLLTQAVFFSETTAEKLTKEECANNQWYAYDSKANDYRCYTRDKQPKRNR